MVARVASFFPRRVNLYVPNMQYAADLATGQPSAFSLGTPAASDDDAIDASIDADAVATTEETQDWTADSTYGRTLIMTPSGDPGNAFAIDVYGFDYLGQPMIERFTGANGSTVVLYGKKAFYRVTKTAIVTAASNAITAKLGTGYRLGLPYKGQVVWAKEANILVPVANREVFEWRHFSDADATSGRSHFVYAEFPGYIKGLYGIPHGGGSTNDPVVTVELGGTAVTGLTVTIDTSNAAGLTASDVPTTEGYNANNRFRKGDPIEIVSAAAASAGAVDVGLLLVPTQQVMPDLTDPATVSVGDPRGSYESLMTLDGSSEIVIGLLPDNYANSSDNGGLHGIRHYFA